MNDGRGGKGGNDFVIISDCLFVRIGILSDFGDILL